jgi:hypothetical protein
VFGVLVLIDGMTISFAIPTRFLVSGYAVLEPLKLCWIVTSYQNKICIVARLTRLWIFIRIDTMMKRSVISFEMLEYALKTSQRSWV